MGDTDDSLEKILRCFTEKRLIDDIMRPHKNSKYSSTPSNGAERKISI